MKKWHICITYYVGRFTEYFNESIIYEMNRYCHTIPVRL